MLSYYRADRSSLLEYHQLPLRSPYFGGGYPLFANPQDGAFNPFIIPVLVFGEVIGIKVNVLLAHLAAALGMYYLTRVVLKYHAAGAFFAALVFCLGGHMHRIMVRGQEYISLFYFFFLPLVLALFIKGRSDKRARVCAVFVLTVMASQAGLYFVPMALFLFLFALMEVFNRGQGRLSVSLSPLKDLFVIFLFVFLLGAVKFFPMLELLAGSPRVMESYNPFWFLSWSFLTRAFFVHQGHFQFEGQHWGYFYLGVVPVLLALSSFLLFWRRTYKYFVLLVIFSLLTFAGHTRLDFFRFLQPLPLFNSIEAPARYFAPLIILCVALAAGQIFSVLDRFKSRWASFLVVALLALTAVDLAVTNSAEQDPFLVPVAPVSHSGPFFQVKNASPARNVSPLIPKRMFLTRTWEWTRPTQYELMRQNIGKINWYGNIHRGEYAAPKYFIDWNGIDSSSPGNYTWRLNPAYRGEIYFLRDAANQATFLSFTPLRMDILAQVTHPDTLVINQNFDKYWISSLARPLNKDGLLSLAFERPGSYRVRLTYVPWPFYFGALVSVLTLFSLLYYLKAGQ